MCDTILHVTDDSEASEPEKTYRTLADLERESSYSMADINAMTRIVIAHHFRHGAWLYECFDYVNERYFNGELKQPIIMPVETHAYGRAVALCGTTGRITINKRQAYPSLQACHIILHESIHHRLQQSYMDSGHSDETWLAECKRIAELLEFPFDPELLALNKPVRNGDSVSRQQPEGTLPYKDAVARFPNGAYAAMGEEMRQRVYSSKWQLL